MAQTKSEVADSLWSSVGKLKRGAPQDNIFEPYRVVGRLRSAALNMAERGSQEIQITLEGATGTAESFDKYDELGRDPIDPFESAFFRRRYYAVPIILSDTENWENKGPERVFNLFQALQRNARNSLLKAINEDACSAQAGKNMLGIQDIIADASGATVGGINSSSSTWWDNQRNTSSATFHTQTTTNIYDGFQAWNDVMDPVAQQGGRVTDIWTTWSIVKAYREALSSQGYARTELSNPGGVGGTDPGDAPPYYGATVLADNDIPANHSYPFDNRHMKLETLRQANFNKTPFVSLQSNGQLAQLAYQIASVQLSTNNRRRLGVATAITGS